MSGYGEFIGVIDGLRGLEKVSPEYRHRALEVYAGTFDEGGVARAVELLAPPAGAGPAVEDAFSVVLQSWWSASDADGVVDVLRWGLDPRPWALVVDDGDETLATAWAALGDGTVANTVRSVGETLAAAASAEGVTHGNLRPAHVRLPEDEPAARVGDWGLGRTVAHAEGRTFVTGFTAPEQLEGSTVDGEAADTYGLAALAYFALTERPPFPEKRAAILGERPRPVSSFRPDLPDAVDDLVMRGLDRDPEERPDGPGAFAAEFEGAMTGDGGDATGAGTPAGGAAVGGAAGPGPDSGSEAPGDEPGGIEAHEGADPDPDPGSATLEEPPADPESVADDESGPLADDDAGAGAGSDTEPLAGEDGGPLEDDSGPLGEDAGPLEDDADSLAADSGPLADEGSGPPAGGEEGALAGGGGEPTVGSDGAAEPTAAGGAPADPPVGGDQVAEEPEAAAEGDGSRVSRRTLLAGGGLVAALAAVGAGAWAFLGGGSSGGADLSVVPDRAETLAAVDVASLRESDALSGAVNPRLPLSLPLLDAGTVGGVLDGVAAMTGMDPEGVRQAVAFAARSAGPGTYAGLVLETEWDRASLPSSLERAGESLAEETYADGRLFVAEYADLPFPVTVGEVGEGRYAVGTRPEVEDVLETASGSTPSVGGRQVEAFRSAADGQVRVGSLLQPDVLSGAVPESVPRRVAAALTETARNVEYVSGSVGADGSARLRAETGSTDAAETAAAQLRAASTLAAGELGGTGAESSLATLASLLEEATVSLEETTVTVSLGSGYELFAAGLAAAE
jgi:hypothetical protein